MLGRQSPPLLLVEMHCRRGAGSDQREMALQSKFNPGAPPKLPTEPPILPALSTSVVCYVERKGGRDGLVGSFGDGGA